MLTNEKDIISQYDKVDLILDHSREEVFYRCPMEAYNAYELRLEPVTRDSDALEFGSRLHKYLETNDEKAWEGYKETGKHKRDHRTKGKGLALGKLYKEKYQEADSNRFTLVSSEFCFAIKEEYAEKKILIKGKIDEILREKETGLLWINEFKHSATYNDETYFKPYYLGHQFKYYIPAIEAMPAPEAIPMQAHAQVGGIIINLFQVTKEATDDADLRRKEIAIEDVTLPDIAIFDTAHDWIDSRERGYWQKRTGACRRFNRMCDFYDICRYGRVDSVMKNYKEKSNNDWHR